MRQYLAFSLAIILSFTSANAWVPPHLGGKKLQVETVILLNEDETPRCRMGDSADDDTFAGLRECDESDELYAILAGDEEISYGAMTPSMFGKVILVAGAIGAATGCLITGLDKKFADQTGFFRAASQYLAATGGLIGAVEATNYITAGATVLHLFMATAGFLGGSFAGIFICRPETEAPSDG